MLPKMDPALREMFLAAYQYLQVRQRPDPFDADFWRRASEDMLSLSDKYAGHPLMERLLIAVYEYLSDQAKEGAR